MDKAAPPPRQRRDGLFLPFPRPGCYMKQGGFFNFFSHISFCPWTTPRSSPWVVVPPLQPNVSFRFVCVPVCVCLRARFFSETRSCVCCRTGCMPDPAMSAILSAWALRLGRTGTSRTSSLLRRSSRRVFGVFKSVILSNSCVSFVSSFQKLQQ